MGTGVSFTSVGHSARNFSGCTGCCVLSGVIKAVSFPGELLEPGDLVDLSTGSKTEQVFHSAGACCLFWVQDAATRSLRALAENWIISKYFSSSAL